MSFSSYPNDVLRELKQRALLEASVNHNWSYMNIEQKKDLVNTILKGYGVGGAWAYSNDYDGTHHTFETEQEYNAYAACYAERKEQYILEKGVPLTFKFIGNHGNTKITATPEFKEAFLMAKLYTVTGKDIVVSNFINPELPNKFTIIRGAHTTQEALEAFLAKIVKAYHASIENQDFKYVLEQHTTVKEKATGKTETINITPASKRYIIENAERYLGDIGSHIRNEVNNFSNLINNGTSKNHLTECVKSIHKLSELGAIFYIKDNFLQSLQKAQDSLLICESGSSVNMIYEAIRFITNAKAGRPKGKFGDLYKLCNISEFNPNSIKDITTEFAKFEAVYDKRSINNKNTINLTFKSDEKPKEVPITIDTFYTLLSTDIGQLKFNMANHWIKQSNYRWNGANETWTSFNKVKTNLMLFGYSEKEAVDYIVEQVKTTKHKVSAGVCYLTKQIVLDMFLVDVRLLSHTTDVKVNMIYVSNHNRHYKRFSIMDNGIWTEQVMNDAEWWQINLHGNHNCSALTYLTPRSAESENVKVISQGKTYDPIPFLGIELEVERREKCAENITKQVMESLGEDFVIMKRDGSLKGHNPFEIVTIPATLQYHQNKWHNFMHNDDLKGNLMSFKGNCGMHIHINKASFTGLHLAKFIRFINMQENRQFIERIAQRVTSNYAQFTDYNNINTNNKVTKGKSIAVSAISQYAKNLGGAVNRNNNGGHYDAVNTSNPMTVELRIFKGNLARGHFFKNIEFTHAAWAYTKNAGMGELNHKDFIHWLFKDGIKQYSYLKDFLIASGYRVSNINVSEDAPASVKEKAKEVDKIHLVLNKRYDKEGKRKLSEKSKTDINNLLHSA